MALLAATTEVPSPNTLHSSTHQWVLCTWGAVYLESLPPGPYSLKHSPVLIKVHTNWARSSTIQVSLQIAEKNPKALKELI